MNHNQKKSNLFTSWQFWCVVAVFACKPINFLIASDVFPFVFASSHLPRVTKVIKNAAVSKYNSGIFAPTETGIIKFSCIMGMYSGAFTVVEAKNPAVKADTNKNTNGSTAQENADVPTPTTAQQQKDAQIITATYSLANDIQPNKFTLKAGQPVRFEINPEDDGQGCMGTIMIPGLTNTPEIIEKNKKIVLSFTPNAGHYQITCAMGIPRGEITVE